MSNQEADHLPLSLPARHRLHHGDDPLHHPGHVLRHGPRHGEVEARVTRLLKIVSYKNIIHVRSSFVTDLHARGEHDDPRPPGGPACHAGVVLLDEVEDARTRVPVAVTSSEECGAAILIIHLQDVVSQRSGACSDAVPN